MAILVKRSGQWVNLTIDAALRLSTPRSIALIGDVTGSTVFDGSTNVSIVTSVVSSAAADSDSEGNKISSTYLKRSGGTMTGNINTTSLIPVTDVAYTLGSSGLRYKDIYGSTLHGNLIGDVTGNVTGNVSGSSSTCTGTAANANSLREIACSTNTTNPTGTDRLNMNCYLYATRVYNAVYNDYAECFDNSDLVYDETKNRIVEVNDEGKVVLAQKNSKYVIGIVSDNYGHLLGGTEEEIDGGDKIPVGVAGVLKVETIEDTDINNRGKFIVSAGDGYGKVVDSPSPGTSIGKIIAVADRKHYIVIISLV